MAMYKKAVYYEDENFKLIVESLDDIPMIHLQLYKASKAILEKVMQVWAEVKALAYWEGYEAIYTYTQDERMFRLFGAEKLPGTFEFNGGIYEVGKWDLK
jgi:hypothetical protein